MKKADMNVMSVEVFNAILRYRETRGFFPPTRDLVYLTSAGCRTSVNKCLEKLEEAGYLRKAGRRNGTITLLRKTPLQFKSISIDVVSEHKKRKALSDRRRKVEGHRKSMSIRERIEEVVRKAKEKEMSFAVDPFHDKYPLFRNGKLHASKVG